MKAKRLFPGLIAGSFLLILILDGKTALAGGQAGMELCIRTVIPSLFPFFLLSIVLTNVLSQSRMGLVRPAARLCGMPCGSESILLCAILGGYPVGAQAVARAYASGQLERQDANRLLSFCSNAGPAFLFGMVARFFPNPWAPALLWAIHVYSALLVGMVISGPAPEKTITASSRPMTLSDAMSAAIRAMAAVCGWILLFRILIAFLQRWLLWLLPAEVQVTVIGLLELSNGCCVLDGVEALPLRFVLCSGILSFGGLCVFMQTQSLAQGLSMKAYLKGKLLQTAFSLLLSAAAMLHIFLPAAGMLFLSAILIQKSQKTSGNPAAVGV